ncbi:MAG: hypothetical protein Q8O56_10145 [Solirubrobacteraceae bacterium]|nr:hypothetical protein [Solirubrobacteraceae bacterium]
MSAKPWTDPDPQPGNFDAELAKLDPRYVEHHDGDCDAKLIVLVGVKGEDAKRLERISEARGSDDVHPMPGPAMRAGGRCV